jgi:hypothetical protein
MSLLFMNMNGLLIKSPQQLRPNTLAYKYAYITITSIQIWKSIPMGVIKKHMCFMNWLLMHINKKPQFDLHCKIYLFVYFIMISCE